MTRILSRTKWFSLTLAAVFMFSSQSIAQEKHLQEPDFSLPEVTVQQAAPAVAVSPSQPMEMQSKVSYPVSRQQNYEQNLIRFTKWDLNADNRLSLNEYMRGSMPVNRTRFSREQVAKLDQLVTRAFDLLDGDQDKIVTKAEYDQYHDMRFSEIDMDQDNLITAEEVTADETRLRNLWEAEQRQTQ